MQRMQWIGLALLIIAAWRTEGYFHPDEHFQLLEFANWKYGLTTADALSWEFGAQMRPALQPAIAWAAIASGRICGLDNPFVLAFLLRLGTGLLAFRLFTKWAVLSPDTGTKLLFYGLVFGCWFMPMLSVRFSSENYAALSLLLGCLYLHDFQKHSGSLKLIGAGLALGISFCFRFQMAFAILGIVCWLLFVRKTGWRHFFLFCAAGLAGVSVGILADRWFYGEWVFTPWNYFRANILEGKAGIFGIEPWWWYLPEFVVKAIPPLSLVLLAGFIAGIRKNKGHVFVWALIPFVLGHSLVGHKELRFLFPMLVPFLWITAQGFYLFKDKKWWSFVIKTMAIINIPLLIYATCIPLAPPVGMFQFLWNYPEKEQITIFAEKETPFRFVGVDVSFYRPEKLNIHIVQAFDSIPQQADIKQGDLLVSQHRLPLTLVPGRQLSLVYQQLPEWLTHFNFNNWQSRTNLWNCYRVE